MARLNFLLIDDHQLVREGLKQLLAKHFPLATLAEASDAASAMGRLAEGEYALILLDIDLPDRGGLDLLGDIMAVSSESRVLVLSGHDEGQFGVRALKAGAAGYISKSAGAEETLAAIRAVLAGRTFVSPDLAGTLVEEMRAGGGAPHESLSEREFEVLRLFGSGCNASAIAKRLGLSVKTVSTYRARILEKLRLRTTGELVRYAVEHKLI